MQKITVSIIIVHYKDKKRLYDCVKSITQSKPKVSFEVIIVDNDEKSTIKKELKVKFKWVKYVRAPGNIGYGAGNNLGAKFAKGEYIFILNSDTKVLSSSIDKLVDFLEKNKQVGLVAPNLVDERGKVFLQIGSRKLTPLRGIVALSFLNKLFPNNPISIKYWLKDVPMNKRREVDVVPGSVMLIRRQVFEKVEGFDENFLLYFEESDFCKRVKELGFGIFIIPEAEIVHYWEEGKPNSKKIKKIFAESRFYYFKKHYGIFKALIVEIFTRFSKWYALLFAITFMGIILRLFRLEDNLVFHGELGHNYLAIKNFVENAQIPLLGPPTVHSWINLGPLFYWLLTPLFYVFDFNPTVGAYFMAIVGISAILVNYFVIGKLFNRKAAIISSFLIVISPAWISLAREARFFSLIPVLFYPFIYYLTVGLQGSRKHLFWTGFFLGVILNFHLASMVLIPATLLLFYIKRKNIATKGLKRAFMGLLIPSLPFLMYNLTHKFDPIIKLGFWIPYRIMGFVGAYPKNVANLTTIKSNFETLGVLFSASYIVENMSFGICLSVAVIVYCGVKMLMISKKKPGWLVLCVIFCVSYLGIFLHGNPPIHYYMPIFALPIILLSLLLSEIWNNKRKYAVLILLAFLTFNNFSYYFSEKWFYQLENEMVSLLVPYSLQLKSARSIIADVNWQDYSFSRIGPFDYYEGDYAQNYRYLMWWLGNEPVENAIPHYIIYEGKDFFPDNKGEDIIFEADDILVIKEKT